MADNGFTLDSLLESLSADSTSADLAVLSLTAKSQQTRPLINYADFSKHMFFGDADKRYEYAIDRILNEYPIGLSGNSVASLNYQDVLNVDKFFKESDDFDIWLIEELSKLKIEDIKKYSVTAGATNTKGEQVKLIHIIRDSENNLIDSGQIDILDEITERITMYEEKNIQVLPQISGTATWIDTQDDQSYLEEVIYPLTSEKTVSRGYRLDNLLPSHLFFGDENNILKSTLYSLSEQLDELKVFAEFMPYNKVVSYSDYDRVPDLFLPVLSREFGVELYDSAANINIDRSIINSSSGGFTSKKITYKIWNRILNNISHLLKTKGTRECIESIARLYGVDRNFIKINEYSIFNGPVRVRDVDEVDIAVLYSDGSNYVETTVGTTDSSSLSFDFPASQDFTIQARVSVSSGVDNYIIKHPYYFLRINNEGELTFDSVTTPSVTVTTPKSSISAFMAEGGFVNVAASRSGDTLSVYLSALYESGTGGDDFVFCSSASYTDSSVANESYDSVGGTIIGGTQFPVDGLFNGYIHEVRSWDASLLLEDIKEHTRNFESVSISNSLYASTPVNYGNLRSHYKLKENIVIKNPYNFIVNSVTAGTTANPIGFDLVNKNYKVFSDEKKLVFSYPVGLYEDNDKIRQQELENFQTDVSYMGMSFEPIDSINRNIKNYIQDVNVFDLLGKAEDHNLHKYTSEYVEKWHELTSLWREKNGEGSSHNAFDYTDDPSSGTFGSIYGVIDLNSYIKSLTNFNDTFGGLFTFSKQFLPARINLLSEGVFIEPHIFERSKIRKRFGYKFNKITELTDETLTADGNVISYDEGSSEDNAAPSVVEQRLFEIPISNRYTISDRAYPDDPNLLDLTASAATTGTFQGYQYTDNPVQDLLNNSYKNGSDLRNLTKNSSTNFPSFSSTRNGIFLPITISPSSPDQSEVDITLDQLLISATSDSDASNGFISGRVRMIMNGKSFKTESNSLKFDFPTSADGTNLFIAEVGDIESGKGRIVKDTDTSISISLPSSEIQFKLVLADVVRSLSAAAGSVTQEMVDNSASGSLGIVPISITNLFNNLSYIIKIGINSDSLKDTDFIRQITQQGIQKVST